MKIPLLSNMNPNRDKILKNFSWILSGKIFQIIGGFLVSAIVARSLGPDLFGAINYSISFCAFLHIFSFISHPTVIKKELINTPEHHNAIMGSSIFLISITNLIIFFLSAIYLFHFNSETDLTKPIIFILSLELFARPFSGIIFWFESEVKSNYIVKSLSISFMLLWCTRLYLVYINATLSWHAVALLAQPIISFASLIYFYIKLHGSIFLWRPSKLFLIKILKQSTPLLFAGISSLIFFKIDNIMIGKLLDNKAVGLYTVATKLSIPWLVITAGIVPSVLPSIFKARKTNINNYYSKLQKVFSLTTLLAVSIGTFVTFTADFWVKLFFSTQYASSAAILKIHIWSLLFISWNDTQHQWDVAEQYLKFALFRSVTAAIINVFLNLLLIPKLGASGAASATITSFFLSSFALNIFNKKAHIVMKMELKSFLFWRYIK